MQTLYASIRHDRGAVSEKFGPNASRFKSMAQKDCEPPRFVAQRVV
jgi:hypothetical protein